MNTPSFTALSASLTRVIEMFDDLVAPDVSGDAEMDEYVERKSQCIAALKQFASTFKKECCDAIRPPLLETHKVEALSAAADERLLVQSYRSKVIRLTEELEAMKKKLNERERNGPILASDAIRSLVGANGDCSTRSTVAAPSAGDRFSRFQSLATAPTLEQSCGQNIHDARACSCSDANARLGCIHKEVLANNIIDRTFDAHKTMLRARLKEAQDELEALRSGATLRKKDEEICELRRALAVEKSATESLQLRLTQQMSQSHVDKLNFTQQLRELQGKQRTAADGSSTATLEVKLRSSMERLQLTQSIGTVLGLLQLQEEYTDGILKCISESIGAPVDDEGPPLFLQFDPCEHNKDAFSLGNITQVTQGLKYRPRLPPQRIANGTPVNQMLKESSRCEEGVGREASGPSDSAIKKSVMHPRPARGLL